MTAEAVGPFGSFLGGKIYTLPHFTVLDVFVDDKESPLVRPDVP